jgi:hypothetical protein
VKERQQQRLDCRCSDREEGVLVSPLLGHLQARGCGSGTQDCPRNKLLRIELALVSTGSLPPVMRIVVPDAAAVGVARDGLARQRTSEGQREEGTQKSFLLQQELPLDLPELVGPLTAEEWPEIHSQAMSVAPVACLGRLMVPRGEEELKVFDSTKL